MPEVGKFPNDIPMRLLLKTQRTKAYKEMTETKASLVTKSLLLYSTHTHMQSPTSIYAYQSKISLLVSILLYLNIVTNSSILFADLLI